MLLRVPLYSALFRCIPFRCRCILCCTLLRIPLYSDVRSAAFRSAVLHCIICCMPLRVPLYSAARSAAFRSGVLRCIIMYYQSQGGALERLIPSLGVETGLAG